MEIDELERRLSELSASEITYKDGMAFDWSIMTEHVEIDGCPVRKIGQPGFAYAQPGMPRGLTIRKNSRFNAVPEHVHDYVELSYVYRGRCPQTVAGRGSSWAATRCFCSTPSARMPWRRLVRTTSC